MAAKSSQTHDGLQKRSKEREGRKTLKMAISGERVGNDRQNEARTNEN